MERFTLEDFNEACKQMDYVSHYREPYITMSFQQKIRLDTYAKAWAIKVKFFWTETKRAYDYCEITPYNKGFLWKIRCFYDGHYDVYFGTVKKCYATTIQDALNFINKRLPNTLNT